jgi:hypothetical protein
MLLWGSEMLAWLVVLAAAATVVTEAAEVVELAVVDLQCVLV